MPRKKKLGHGTKVTVNAVAFDFLTEFTPPSISRATTDVTVMDDEAVDSLDSDPPDYGSISLNGLYDVDSVEDEAILTFMLNDDISEREATIAVRYRKTGTGTAPAASTWTYNTITYTGRITKFEQQKVTQKDKMMLVIEMKVTKKPVKS